MRIVLDTNVWVSALCFPGGACDQLLARLRRQPAAELVASPFILQEFEQVLRVKLGYAHREAAAVVHAIREMVTLVEPQSRIHVIREKASDNRILECAVSGEAALLVTGDAKHLLPLRTFQTILIRSPREVLDHWPSP